MRNVLILLIEYKQAVSAVSINCCNCPLVATHDGMAGGFTVYCSSIYLSFVVIVVKLSLFGISRIKIYKESHKSSTLASRLTTTPLSIAIKSGIPLANSCYFQLLSR